MKYFLSIFLFSVFVLFPAQSKKTVKKTPVKKTISKPDLEKIDPELPDLILQRDSEGKLGFVNQKGQLIIPHEYKFGTFFWEDCNLLNSPNENVRKFGSADYASVTVDGKDYRINRRNVRGHQSWPHESFCAHSRRTTGCC